MASDYGGTYGGQPWHGAQPQYGPQYGGPPGGWAPPPGSGPPPRRRQTRIVAIAALVLGGLGLVGFGIGVWTQVAPRKFTAEQRQQITNWEFGKRWRDLTAGVIFPASVTYTPPAALDDMPALTLSAERVGVAKETACASATDSAAAAVLDRDGCAAMLRATYVDSTDSYVVTVGAAVLPGAAAATSAAQAIASANAARSAVHAVPFNGTPAAAFTNKRRQVSGVVSAGTYVVLYTVGFADSRPKEPVTGDGYTDAEMTSAGTGVAHDVLSLLAAPVTPPSCPGAPGC